MFGTPVGIIEGFEDVALPITAKRPALCPADACGLLADDLLLLLSCP
jgi:hypothetical protein